MTVPLAPRWACTIELPEVVIVTGGSERPSLVTVYTAQGWLEDWPSLNTGREDHACGHYVNTDNREVGGECTVLYCTVLYCTVLYCTAGVPRDLVTAGAAAWVEAGPLPLHMSGLAAVSLDNQIIVTGAASG